MHSAGAAAAQVIEQTFGADELAPELGAQVRCVDAAEDSVPIGVIALRAQKMLLGQRILGAFLFAHAFRSEVPMPF